MSENHRKTSSPLSKIADSAVVLGIAALIANMLAYMYELVYFSHFGVAADEVRIRLEVIIPMFVLVLVTGSVIGLYGHYVYLMIKARNLRVRLVGRMIAVGFGFSAFLAPMFYLINPATAIQKTIIALFLQWIVVLIFYALVGMVSILRRNKVGRSFKVIDKTVGEIKTLAQTHAHVFRYSIPLLLGLPFVIFLCLALATFDAKHKNFVVTNYGDSDLAIIREYDSTIIAVGFDSKDNALLPRYYSIERSELPVLAYRHINSRPDDSKLFLKSRLGNSLSHQLTSWEPFDIIYW